MAEKPKYKKQIQVKKAPATPVTGVQKKAWKIPPWAIYAVLTLTAVIYLRSLFNGFVTWDDDGYVCKNKDIMDFSFNGIKTIFSSFYVGNYQPLSMLTYLFEYRLFGLNPFPYHLLNMLLHLANVFLVYLFIKKLSGQEFTAVFVAAIFGVHPMHVESVAWIAERKDVLYTVFYLGALTAYLNFMKSGFNFKARYYWVCILLFILSLLSKSASVTLPVIMLAIDIYKKRKFSVKLFAEKVPFFLLSLLFGIIALFSQEESLSDFTPFYTVFERIFLFTYTISYYIIMMIAPVNLSAMHYYPDKFATNTLPWEFFASLPFLLFIIFIIVKPSRMRREKIFGTAFFLIVISIMLQVISVGVAITSERYTYVSYIGTFFIIGHWISKIQRPERLKLAMIVSGIFILMFSYLTWDRIGVWKSGITLFDDVVKKYPESPVAFKTRAFFKNELKDYDGALQDFNMALQLNPNINECLASRGKILIDKKQYQAALADLNKSLTMDTTAADVFNNRGMAYQGMNDTAAALRDFNKAIKKDPKMQSAYNNRCILRAIMGNISGAIEDADKAILLNPKESNSYCNRANIKTLIKDYRGAINDYNAALQLKPDDNQLFFNRGMARLNTSDTSGACEDWNSALNLGDQNAGDMIKKYCK